MGKFELKIGRLDIDPRRLEFTGSDPYDAVHKFIVEHADAAMLLFACADASRHWEVRNHFGKRDDDLVAGGSLYTRDEKLILADYSGDYGALPPEEAQVLAELTLQHLAENFGLNLKKASGIPSNRGSVNPMWSK